MNDEKEKTKAFRFKNKRINWLLQTYSRALKIPISNYVENLIIQDLQKEETYEKIRRSKLYYSEYVEKITKEIKELKKPKRRYYVPERPNV